MTGLDRAVASRLEVLRTSLALPLDVVAGRAGLSVEGLAILEGAAISGTLTEIVRIADALETSAAHVLVPALAESCRPWAKALDDSSWSLLFTRCVARVRSPRRRTMLLECAKMLEEAGQVG